MLLVECIFLNVEITTRNLNNNSNYSTGMSKFNPNFFSFYSNDFKEYVS